jgi:hypothetical protein
VETDDGGGAMVEVLKDVRLGSYEQSSCQPHYKKLMVYEAACAPSHVLFSKLHVV